MCVCNNNENAIATSRSRRANQGPVRPRSSALVSDQQPRMATASPGPQTKFAVPPIAALSLANDICGTLMRPTKGDAQIRPSSEEGVVRTYARIHGSTSGEDRGPEPLGTARSKFLDAPFGFRARFPTPVYDPRKRGPRSCRPARTKTKRSLRNLGELDQATYLRQTARICVGTSWAQTHASGHSKELSAAGARIFVACFMKRVVHGRREVRSAKKNQEKTRKSTLSGSGQDLTYRLRGQSASAKRNIVQIRALGAGVLRVMFLQITLRAGHGRPA